MYSCVMCKYEVEDNASYVEHVVRNHELSDTFTVTCTFDGCGVSYNNWNSYKMHVKRSHKQVQVENNLEDEYYEVEELHRNAGPIEHVERAIAVQNNREDPEFQAAKLMLYIKEDCNITQKAAASVTIKLHSYITKLIHSSKQAILSSVEHDELVFEQVKEHFCRIEREVNSVLFFKDQENLRRYLIKKCGLLKPEKIDMCDSEWVWRRNRYQELVLRETHDSFYQIPFLKTLEILLNNDQIYEYVIQSRNFNSHEEGVISNYLDGSYVQEVMSLFVCNIILIIMLYYDDVEVVNPLGSNIGKHKLGMFYWALGNIPPHLRSTIQSINLLAIIKTKLLRQYGPELVVKDFLDGIKKLESEEGVDFVIRDQKVNLRGFLLLVSADTLGSNYLSGFKEGVGKATKPCRSCDATREDISTKFLENKFKLRDKISHNHRLEIILTADFTNLQRSFWSRIFGVNPVHSPLSSLQFFDVTKCMVHDLMHVLFEGVLEANMRYFLYNIIVVDKIMTCNELNEALIQFSYQIFESDKPSPIELVHLTNGIKQSASKMVALAFCLPFVLVPFVEKDDKRLLLLIQLLKIVNLCMCFKITTENVLELAKLIEEHHYNFHMLYPEASITPKFHYLVHLPTQILKFGPLRYHWCMRYEAFHLQFKNWAKSMNNFKNIAFSLAYRFQMKRILQLDLNDSNAIYLRSNINVNHGFTVNVIDHPDKDLLINYIVGIDVQDLVMNTNSIVENGVHFKVGYSILLKDTEDELPHFGFITNIIIHKNKKYLVFNKLNTLAYIAHLNAYYIKRQMPLNSKIIVVNDLMYSQGLPAFRLNNKYYVVLLYYNRIEE